jgi:RNA polymerase sigma-70 factor, ECF subfamily
VSRDRAGVGTEDGVVSTEPCNPDSVQHLYERHGRALLAYACSLTPDSGKAEDIVHQVFLRLLTRRITCPDSPLPYLLRAVRNTALNEQRRWRREVELTDAVGWLEAPPGRHEEALALEAALRTLPQEQRELIVLRIWAQLSFEEAAAVVGCSPNTAASRFRYGRDKLRAILRPLARK